jgi:hypothetical protein
MENKWSSKRVLKWALGVSIPAVVFLVFLLTLVRSTAVKWLHEQITRDLTERSVAKRRWEREHLGPCAQHGDCLGSDCPVGRGATCRYYSGDEGACACEGAELWAHGCQRVTDCPPCIVAGARLCVWYPGSVEGVCDCHYAGSDGGLVPERDAGSYDFTLEGKLVPRRGDP